MLLWKKSQNKVSSREQISIKEVKDGILTLASGEHRIVLETSSVNFELKSESEQEVLIDSFQNYLNSLPCPIQVLIRVRELDIDSYVEDILAKSSSEKVNVYKEQIENYCHFIRNLVSGNKILSRRFYIVIPYHVEEKTNDFALVKEQLKFTRELIAKGLERLGMKARQLESLELLDLFYSFYNKNHVKSQQLKGKTIEMLVQNNYV